MSTQHPDDDLPDPLDMSALPSDGTDPADGQMPLVEAVEPEPMEPRPTKAADKLGKAAAAAEPIQAPAQGPAPRSSSGGSLLGNNKRQRWGILVVAVMLAVGLLAIAAIARRSKQVPATQKMDIDPKTQLGNDIDQKYESFMGMVKDKLPKALESGRQNAERMTALETRVDTALRKMEEARAADARRLDESLKKLSADLVGSHLSKGGQAVQAGDLDSFVNVLKQQQARNGLNLDEARLRLETWLKSNGFSGPGLALLRDRSLDQLGFLYVGEVAEPPFIDADLDELPPILRGPARELYDRHISDASFSGRVLLREDEDLTWLSQRLGKDAAATSEEDRRRAVQVARIRKENVTPEMEQVLPDLAAKRDAQGILPSDRFRLESFVWETKKTRFPALTPGQHLSLVMALAGMRANSNGNFSSQQRVPSASDRTALTAAARDAAKVALSQGVKDQNLLLQRARLAASAKSTDLRLVLPPAELEQQVTIGVAEAIRTAQGVPAEPAPTEAGSPRPAEREPSVAVQPVAPVTLHSGPLAVPREDAAAVGLDLAFITLTRLKLDPSTPEGVAAATALLTASPGIANAAWQAVSEHDRELTTFARAVVEEYQGIAAEARSAAGIPVHVAGLTGDDAARAQAFELGRVVGSQSGTDKGVLNAALKRRLEELAVDGLGHASLGKPRAEATPWLRYLSEWRSLGYPALHKDPGRLVDMITLLGEQLQERQVAHQQVTLPGYPRGFRDKVVREVDDALPMSLATNVAQLAGTRIPLETLRNRVVAAENRYAVALIAEALLSAKAVQAVNERFANLLDSDSLLTPLYASLAKWVPDQVHAVMEQKKPDLTDTNVGPVAVEIATSLIDPANLFLARQVITGNLEPRIRSAAGSLNQGGYQAAMEAVEDRLQKMDLGNLSIRRIDEATQELHKLALDTLQGPPQPANLAGRPPAASGAAGKPGSGGINRPGFFDLKDEGLPGLAIGSVTEQVAKGRVLGIPRGSAMHCYLEIGTDLPIKSQEGGVDLVQFRAVGGFFAPDGTWFPLPPCVLQGKAKPNPGANRNQVQLTSISLLLGGRDTLEKEITGVVTDEVSGQNGMLAKFDRHLELIVPEAAVVSVTSGIAAAAASQNSTTTQVVPGSTTTTTDPTSSARQGLGAGLQKGTDLINKYEESYLEKLSPTMWSPNGQKLVAYFFSTVEFPELTEADFRRALQARGGRWNGF